MCLNKHLPPPAINTHILCRISVLLTTFTHCQIDNLAFKTQKKDHVEDFLGLSMNEPSSINKQMPDT